MAKRRWLMGAMSLTVLWGLAAAPAAAQAPSGPVKMEWLSWSIFRFTSPTGKVVLTNPFVMNPDSPVKVDDFAKVDVIVVADGHADEVGSAAEIGLKTGAKIISTWEMWYAWFQPRNFPMAQVLRNNPGDWNKFDGITIRNVNSVHGSGTADKFYGGAAMGFIIKFENGLSVYFAGSTALTMDMRLWGSLYKPDVAILPLSGDRDPEDIVHMVRFLQTDNPNLKTIIPHHHRLKPPAGAPTPADLEKVLKAARLSVKVLDPELSKIDELTK